LSRSEALEAPTTNELSYSHGDSSIEFCEYRELIYYNLGEIKDYLFGIAI